VRLRARVTTQEGFGLVELLMAMVMLNIGILALVAAFQSGAFALQRASKISTASAIADIQMERYRALKYDYVMLDTTALSSAQGNAVYTGDTAYSATQVTGTCPTAGAEECQAMRTLTGPDGKNYRIDTYIVLDSVSSSRQFKKVTIVVRDARSLTGRPLARIASTFDASTGS